MRVHFASMTIDLAYNEEKNITIKRFPTEFEIEKLKKSKYKLVDEEAITVDNQLIINIYYSPSRKFVKVFSGGNYDFREGARHGVDIDIKIKQAEEDLLNYLCEITRELCKKHLKACVLLPSRHSINCQIDEFKLTQDKVKIFLEEFVTNLEGKMEEFRITKKEKEIETKAEEKVRKYEEKEALNINIDELQTKPLEPTIDKEILDTNLSHINCEKCGHRTPKNDIRKIFLSSLNRNVYLCPSCYSFGSTVLEELEKEIKDNEKKHDVKSNKKEEGFWKRIFKRK